MPSPFFRVAREGATTDGRNIERSWIEQMAASYNRKTYAARVWVEHIRGIHPTSDFKAYGDVLAVEAREDDGRLGLYVQIEPTPELVAMNKARQKLFTSIEINPKFADTGEAYLVGLAVTDSPASLGTDQLQFCAQRADASPLAGRKLHTGNLFSATADDVIELGEAPGPSLLDRVKKMFATHGGRTDAQHADTSAAVEAVAQHVGELEGSHNELASYRAQDRKELDTLRADFNALRETLDKTPAGPAAAARPPATGAVAQFTTDC